MALDIEEWDPRGGLLANLLHGVVVQQVGQPHLCVSNVVAERQVPGNVDAERFPVLSQR